MVPIFQKDFPDIECGRIIFVLARRTTRFDTGETHECFQMPKLLSPFCFELSHPENRSTDVDVFGSSSTVDRFDLSTRAGRR
jgi:hypothetical protein